MTKQPTAPYEVLFHIFEHLLYERMVLESPKDLNVVFYNPLLSSYSPTTLDSFPETGLSIKIELGISLSASIFKKSRILYIIYNAAKPHSIAATRTPPSIAPKFDVPSLERFPPHDESDPH